MTNRLQQLTEKKKKLDSLKPFPRKASENIDEWFKLLLTYHSNAIEDNSLTLLETAKIIGTKQEIIDEIKRR